jgi:hypothetical protein
MYQLIDEYAFVQAFEGMGRAENFSREARRALYDYYTDLEAETGEPMELDVIAICCDWCEYTVEELTDEFPDAIDSDGDVDLDWFRDQTDIVEVDHYGDEPTYLVQVF